VFNQYNALLHENSMFIVYSEKMTFRKFH